MNLSLREALRKIMSSEMEVAPPSPTTCEIEQKILTKFEENFGNLGDFGHCW